MCVCVRSRSSYFQVSYYRPCVFSTANCPLLIGHRYYSLSLCVCVCVYIIRVVRFLYIASDNIVTVVLMMCNLTLSSILQKPNKACTHYAMMKPVKQCAYAFTVHSFTA